MIEKAIQQARLNPILPIGRNSISRFAAILYNGDLEFIGLNSYKSHPLQAKFGSNETCIHIHAELDAIVKATRWLAKQSGVHYNRIDDLSGFSITVARVLKDGTPAIAKPCVGCQKALIHFGVKNIEWTT